MAFKLVNAVSDQSPAMFRIAKTTEGAMVKGDVLAWDVSNNALERATSSSTTLTVFAVCMETRVTADVDVLVIILNPTQVWEADAANDGATTQTGERAVLTDHDTLNNTSTDSTTTSGVFRILGYTGVTTEKKVLVQPLVPMNITA